MPTILDGRAYLRKGETCTKVCKWPCIAKWSLEIDFSCGLYGGISIKSQRIIRKQENIEQSIEEFQPFIGEIKK